MYVSALCACMEPMEVRRSFGFCGTRFTRGYKTLCGCWELNEGPLQDQLMILTDKPSIPPQEGFLSV